ncbi:glycosyl hydrolases family 31-domain-containing protein [Aspergillus germanicus]
MPGSSLASQHVGGIALLSSCWSCGHSTSKPNCPGYRASHVHEGANTLTAHLTLAGKPCNTYGTDLKDLRLLVEYQTDERLHVKIYDANEQVYQVPEAVLPRVDSGHGQCKHSAFKFDYVKEPFSFTVSRGNEVLFDTSASNLVFQSQYLKLRTWLPDKPNLYGLGEHTDSLQLGATNYTRTFWNRDAYTVPTQSNLYGSHPVYYDHRASDGTHGVFLLNSNGMDVKINKTQDGKQYLEYNTLGGVFDFYFFTGSTPKEASMQYAEIVGLPVMQSYWAFGFHQRRYGYRDVFQVAEVVYNYSKAGIPLETMWTDIDYMELRRVFTLDPERFPLERMRELVDYLHDHDQKYTVMVDPAVSTIENPGYRRGVEQDIFLKTQNGGLYTGAVWPGVTVYPDWFHPGIEEYWNGEFNDFFDADTGVDIDGLWIDMNEAANFCPFPCTDTEQYAIDNDLPPAPPPVRPSNPRPIPGFPDNFQPASSALLRKRAHGDKIGLPNRNLHPPYAIQNAAGPLSMNTIQTDIVHAGDGYAEYDTIFTGPVSGMMSSASRNTMQQRRPNVRPLVITRSTYAGAGAHVRHWLGDNVSTWEQYRTSIAQIVAFASMFQIPMVGADVCGFAEYYLWPTVTESATKAIDIRYRLLDYIYTAFHKQSQTGEPFLQPFFYIYPEDENTFSNDLQFFYGDALLISPVVEENSTSVDAYFPKDIFYDWYTGAALYGKGKVVTLTDIEIIHIPIHIRGGSIIPVRSSGAMTTMELREKSFQLIIAPGLDGKAFGSLYLDDGDSLEQTVTVEIEFEYRRGLLWIKGRFHPDAPVRLESITLLGQGPTKDLKQIIPTDWELTDPTQVELA